MKHVKHVPMGRLIKVVLNDKWLISANPSIDYSRADPTGLIILDHRGKRIGKVLDVLGSVKKPFLLVEPLTPEEPSGEVFLEMPKRRGDRR